MARLFEHGPDEDYWFSDDQVKIIRSIYKLKQGEMFSPCPINILEELKPTWASWRKFDWGGICHNCGEVMLVSGRQGFMQNSASCICGHHVTRGCFSNSCSCSFCETQEKEKVEKRKREEKEKQDEWDHIHTCGKCGLVKEDVTGKALHGLICKSCFIKIFNECWKAEEEYIDAIKPIFDSEPERWTFSILRTSYPNLILIPNAALLSFLSLEAIEQSLSTTELDYLYKGRVDLLIVEPANFKPVLAIELDSSWHDDDRVRRNDNRKEKILSLANLPLERFRQNGFSTFGEIETTLNAYFGRGEK